MTKLTMRCTPTTISVTHVELPHGLHLHRSHLGGASRSWDPLLITNRLSPDRTGIPHLVTARLLHRLQAPKVGAPWGPGQPLPGLPGHIPSSSGHGANVVGGPNPHSGLEGGVGPCPRYVQTCVQPAEACRGRGISPAPTLCATYFFRLAAHSQLPVASVYPGSVAGSPPWCSAKDIVSQCGFQSFCTPTFSENFCTALEFGLLVFLRSTFSRDCKQQSGAGTRSNPCTFQQSSHSDRSQHG